MYISILWQLPLCTAKPLFHCCKITKAICVITIYIYIYIFFIIFKRLFFLLYHNVDVGSSLMDLRMHQIEILWINSQSWWGSDHQRMFRVSWSAINQQVGGTHYVYRNVKTCFHSQQTVQSKSYSTPIWHCSVITLKFCRTNFFFYVNGTLLPIAWF